MNKKIDIPQSFLDKFNHKNIEFKTSEFETMMLNDIYSSDESTKIKLHRNVTDVFLREFNLFIEQKRNIRYNIKGETRDGKSYCALKIMYMYFLKQGKDFNDNAEYFICGNQIEYRQKLQNAVFGDFFIIDENFFTRSGLGANIEFSQLTDFNNVIAKQNIGNIYITPQRFLPTGAVLGLSTYGRDNHNWLTRCLLYKMKESTAFLIGYIIFDIGKLYRDNGCFIYRQIGGCTNHKKFKVEDIDSDNIKYSWCIDEKFKQDLSQFKTEKVKDCPFYNVCEHGICRYEKKKDTWISKELSGGIDDKTKERFTIALKLILDLNATIIHDENGTIIRLGAKSGKDLKVKAKLKVNKFSNSKLGIAEFDEILEMVKSNTDINMLCDTLTVLEDKDLIKQFIELDKDNNIVRDKIDKILKQKEKDKKEDEKKRKKK